MAEHAEQASDLRTVGPSEDTPVADPSSTTNGTGPVVPDTRPARTRPASPSADRSPVPLRSPFWYVRIVKPVMDRMAAVLLLVILGPLLLCGMAAVRMTLGPKVFFVQQRVGLAGQVFSTYKLRTMVHDRRTTSEADLIAFEEGQWDGFERRRTHKSASDPRLTRVGRLLRTFSIDEIPQLLNILKGDMSLVGPRPEIPGVVNAHYQSWMHRRHVVKPGLTGLWQVSERGNGMMHEHVDVDLDYVDSVGLWTDVKILLITPYAVLARRGF